MAKVFWFVGQIVLLGGATIASANSISPLICPNAGSTTASPTDTTINANSCTDFSYTFPNTPQPAAGTNNWQYGYYLGPINPAAFTLFPQQVTLPNGDSYGTWALDFNRYFTSLDAFGGHANGEFTDLHIPPFCDDALYQNCSPSGGIDPRSPNSPGSATQEAVRRYLVPSGVGTATLNIGIQVQKDPRTTPPSAHGTIEYVILYSGGVATTLITLADPVNFDPNIAGAPPTDQGIPQPVYSASVSNVVVKPGDVIDFVMSTMTDPNYNNQSVDFSSGTFELITIQSVPEPATLVLVGGSLLLIGSMFRKRRS